MSSASEIQSSNLNLGYVLDHFRKNPVDLINPEAAAARISEWTERFSLEACEQLSRDVTQLDSSRSGGIHPSLLLRVTDFVSALLLQKRGTERLSSIERLLEERRYEAALRQILDLGVPSEMFKDTLEQISEKLISLEKWSTASEAVSHLPDSAKKRQLEARIKLATSRGRTNPSGANRSPLNLSFVLRIFHGIAPGGMNDSNHENEIMAFTNEWVKLEMTYTLSEFEQLVKEIDGAKTRLNSASDPAYAQSIETLVELVKAMLLTKPFRRSIQEGEFKKAFDCIRDSDGLNQDEKNEQFLLYYSRFMTERNFEKAGLALSYLPVELKRATLKLEGAWFN